MNRKIFRAVGTGLVVTVFLSACGKGKTEVDEKIKISIGEWPIESRVELVKSYEEHIDTMKKEYPEIEVVPDDWEFDLTTFRVKAATGQLPTMYLCWLTETRKIIDGGYSADITDILEELDYIKYFKKDAIALCEKDGRYYGLPQGNFRVTENFLRMPGLWMKTAYHCFPILGKSWHKLPL